MEGKVSKFGLIVLCSFMIVIAGSGVVLAPQPQVTFVGVPYHEGDTVTVQWSCDISTVKMLIIAWIGGVQIHRDTINGKTQGLETFVASMSGILKVYISCYDSDNYGIGNEESISIHPVIQDGTDGDENPDDSNLVLWLIAGLLLITVILIVVALMKRRTGQPPTQ